MEKYKGHMWLQSLRLLTLDLNGFNRRRNCQSLPKTLIDFIPFYLHNLWF